MTSLTFLLPEWDRYSTSIKLLSNKSDHPDQKIM